MIINHRKVMNSQKQSGFFGPLCICAVFRLDACIRVYINNVLSIGRYRPIGITICAIISIIKNLFHRQNNGN